MKKESIFSDNNRWSYDVKAFTDVAKILELHINSKTDYPILGEKFTESLENSKKKRSNHLQLMASRIVFKYKGKKLALKTLKDIWNSHVPLDYPFDNLLLYEG